MYLITLDNVSLAINTSSNDRRVSFRRVWYDVKVKNPSTWNWKIKWKKRTGTRADFGTFILIIPYKMTTSLIFFQSREKRIGYVAFATSHSKISVLKYFLNITSPLERMTRIWNIRVNAKIHHILKNTIFISIVYEANHVCWKPTLTLGISVEKIEMQRSVIIFNNSHSNKFFFSKIFALAKKKYIESVFYFANIFCCEIRRTTSEIRIELWKKIITIGKNVFAAKYFYSIIRIENRVR